MPTRTTVEAACVSKLLLASTPALRTFTALNRPPARLLLIARREKSVLSTASVELASVLLSMAVLTTSPLRESSVFAEDLSQQVVLSRTTTTRSETAKILVLSQALTDRAVRLGVPLDSLSVRRTGIGG
jgi:hypothetical protein